VRIRWGLYSSKGVMGYDQSAISESTAADISRMVPIGSSHARVGGKVALCDMLTEIC